MTKKKSSSSCWWSMMRKPLPPLIQPPYPEAIPPDRKFGPWSYWPYLQRTVSFTILPSPCVSSCVLFLESCWEMMTKKNSSSSSWSMMKNVFNTSDPIQHRWSNSHTPLMRWWITLLTISKDKQITGLLMCISNFLCESTSFLDWKLSGNDDQKISSSRRTWYYDETSPCLI